MATDVERMILQLEANLSRYTREMERARRDTDRRIRDIEQSARRGAGNIDQIFARMGAGMRAGILGAIGGLGVQQAFQQIRQAASELAQTMSDATRAGLGVEEFQALKFAAEQSRIGVDGLVDGLKELQLRVDEVIVSGGGSASEALTRLGFSAEELAAKIRDPIGLFDEIIDRARELDRAAQIRILDEVFGGTGGESFLQLMRDGQRGLADLQAEARASGAVLDEELIDKAVDIDREFNKIATTVGTTLKGAIVSATYAVRDFLRVLGGTGSGDSVSPVQAIDGQLAALEAQLAQQRGLNNMAAVGQLEGLIADLRVERSAAAEAQRELQRGLAFARDPMAAEEPASPAAPAAPYRGGAPVTETGGRGARGSANAIVDGYAKIIAAGQQRISQLQLERDTMGLTIAAAAALTFEQEALAQAQRDGVALTEAQRAEIAGLATEYGALTEAVAAAAETQQRLDEVSGMVADTMTDVFTGLVTGANNAQEALAGLLQQLGRLLVNRAFTSLLDGVFGAQGGGLGKGIGKLLGFADGGLVRGPGTSQSDSVLARLSNGEYVVNAKSAREYRGLLEAINGGALPRFASGGLVAPGAEFGREMGFGEVLK